MSGGKRINDYGGMPHTSEMAMKSKNMVKEYKSADGSGHQSYFEDTTEAIKRAQDMGDSKAKGHKMKDGYRN